MMLHYQVRNLFQVISLLLNFAILSIALQATKKSQEIRVGDAVTESWWSANNSGTLRSPPRCFRMLHSAEWMSRTTMRKTYNDELFGSLLDTGLVKGRVDRECLASVNLSSKVTMSEAFPDIVISGDAYSSDVNGIWVPSGILNGKPRYTNDRNISSYIEWTGSQWELQGRVGVYQGGPDFGDIPPERDGIDTQWGTFNLTLKHVQAFPYITIAGDRYSSDVNGIWVPSGISNGKPRYTNYRQNASYIEWTGSRWEMQGSAGLYQGGPHFGDIPPESDGVDNASWGTYNLALQHVQAPFVQALNRKKGSGVLFEEEMEDLSGADFSLAWFHPPNTGGDFSKTLARYSGEALVPHDQSLSKLASKPKNIMSKKALGEKFGHFDEFDVVTSEDYGNFYGRFFGMFRTPADRMYAAWNYYGKPANRTPESFRDKNAGFVTKMLAGQRLDEGYPQIQVALNRLDAFAFVGLSNHWNLSICLFHAMHGGTISPEEFEISESPEFEDEDPKIKEFFGQHDDIEDNELYAKASHIFWTNVRKYQVRLKDCYPTKRKSKDGPDAMHTAGILTTDVVLDDCAAKGLARLPTDPSWFWNNRSSEWYHILEPYMRHPPKPAEDPDAQPKSNLAILMLSDDGSVAHQEMWKQWVEHAENMSIKVKFGLHAGQPEKIPKELRRFIFPFVRKTSWCNCRNAVLSSMQQLLLDPEVTHVAVVASNAVPIKSLSYINAMLDLDPSSRFCQDRAWMIPRAETWWVMSRFDAELAIKYQGRMEKAIKLGICKDAWPEPCVDENSWLAPLIMRNLQWGHRSPLRDECPTYTDWGGTCKGWARHGERCNCPNLLEARVHATQGHPAAFVDVSMLGFTELLSSPFWFARKFDANAFGGGWDPVSTALASWEKDVRIVKHNLSMFDVNADHKANVSAKCDARVLADLHDKGVGLIISGQSGYHTRAVQELVSVAETHEFGRLENETSDGNKDSWAVRSTHSLLSKVGLLRVLQEFGSVTYEPEEIKPLALRERLLDGACTALMKVHATSNGTSKPWALKDPSLRLYLPFFDRVVGPANYKFIHVVHDVRNIRDTRGDEDWAFVHQNNHIDRAMEVGNATFFSQWAGSVDIEKWVKFAYVWGIIEMDLHLRWTKDRSENYQLITEMDMQSFSQPGGKSETLTRFLGGSPSTRSKISEFRATRERHSLEDEDHFDMMDAIVKLPGMEVTRKALKTFGYKLNEVGSTSSHDLVDKYAIP